MHWNVYTYKRKTSRKRMYIVQCTVYTVSLYIKVVIMAFVWALKATKIPKVHYAIHIRSLYFYVIVLYDFCYILLDFRVLFFSKTETRMTYVFIIFHKTFRSISPCKNIWVLIIFFVRRRHFCFGWNITLTIISKIPYSHANHLWKWL